MKYYTVYPEQDLSTPFGGPLMDISATYKEATDKAEAYRAKHSDNGNNPFPAVIYGNNITDMLSAFSHMTEHNIDPETREQTSPESFQVQVVTVFGKVEVTQMFTSKSHADYYRAGLIMGLLINNDKTRFVI